MPSLKLLALHLHMEPLGHIIYTKYIFYVLGPLGHMLLFFDGVALIRRHMAQNMYHDFDGVPHLYKLQFLCQAVVPRPGHSASAGIFEGRQISERPFSIILIYIYIYICPAKHLSQTIVNFYVYIYVLQILYIYIYMYYMRNSHFGSRQVSNSNKLGADWGSQNASVCDFL